MLIVIERLFPNGMYRVEAKGVGCPRTFFDLTEAKEFAAMLAGVYRSAGYSAEISEAFK